MEYTNLGRTGLKVSKLCLGCMSFGSPKWAPWVLDEEASLPIIKTAYDLGINFFDTADVYSNGHSEIVLGNALKKLGIDRADVVIATKVYCAVAKDVSYNTLHNAVKSPNGQGLSRKHIMHAVEDSLKRLQTEYIDLYQIHRFDENTPVEETMCALNDLVKSGKVRYIGASSMYAWQFAKAQAIAKEKGWTQFISMQNFYNLLYREEEREMIPTCKDQGVGLIPWSPLMRGVLCKPAVNPEKTIRAESDAFLKKLTPDKYHQVDMQIVSRVQEVAEKKKVSMAQVALAWLFSKPSVCSPIVGFTKEEQLKDAVLALQVKLQPEEIEYLEQPYLPKSIMGHR